MLPTPSEGRLKQSPEGIARGHDSLHVPLGQRRVDRQGECLVGSAFGLGQRRTAPELGQPVHGRLHRHPTVDPLAPQGSGERVPVRTAVARNPHDVLLVGVPVPAIGRADSAQLPVEIAGPLTTLSDLVVRRLGLTFLQHQQPVPLPDVEEPSHVGLPPEAVYDDNGRGPGSYGGFDSGRIEAVGHRMYVREDRKRTSECHRLGDLDVPEGRYDDLVTDSDAAWP